MGKMLTKREPPLARGSFPFTVTLGRLGYRREEVMGNTSSFGFFFILPEEDWAAQLCL